MEVTTIRLGTMVNTIKEDARRLIFYGTYSVPANRAPTFSQ
jgi:hypothetical protein